LRSPSGVFSENASGFIGETDEIESVSSLLCRSWAIIVAKECPLLIRSKTAVGILSSWIKMLARAM
jgi:hypothetical protein